MNDINKTGIPDLERERDRLRAGLKSFESLTPGGSEFVDDPKAVLAWLKDRLATSGSLAAERNALRAERDEMREALGEADMELQSANFRTAHAVLRAVLAKYSKRDGKIWADDPLEKGEDLPVKIIGKYKETP